MDKGEEKRAHVFAVHARAQRQGGAERTRAHSNRIGSDGFGGVGMAAVVRSPPVPRWIGWVAKARGSGWTGRAGRLEKARRGAGPDRAGQEDGVGIGGGGGEQRSGVRRGSRRSASA